MAMEKVRAHFRKYGLKDRIRELDISGATVELAAQTLSCEPARIAKTLKRFDTVFPANSAIGLTIPELEAYSGYAAWWMCAEAMKGSDCRNSYLGLPALEFARNS